MYFICSMVSLIVPKTCPLVAGDINAAQKFIPMTPPLLASSLIISSSIFLT